MRRSRKVKGFAICLPNSFHEEGGCEGVLPEDVWAVSLVSRCFLLDVFSDICVMSPCL